MTFKRGHVVTEEMKKKISKSLKGQRKNIKFSEEHKRKLSISHKGNCHSEETKRKISENSKRNLNYGMKGKLGYWKGKIGPNNGKQFSNETKKKMRISMINHIKKYRGNVKPNVGKHEKQYLDFIEDAINYKIIRQYPVNGYFLDGYCKERNLAIEIDERPKITIKDIERQKIIEQELNCNFLRINI